MAVFQQEFLILKTMMFGDVMTVLNERKHLKMVINSVLDFRLNQVPGPNIFTPHTFIPIKVM
jgi:hypothetical protein